MIFAWTGKALRKVYEIWHLPLPEQPLSLFALRGGKLVRSRNSWSSQLEIKTVNLDYRHMRCTFGIWDQRTDRIFAAPGSSVPYIDNVLKAAHRQGIRKGRGTNQMEPGFYQDLSKGEHLQGKPMGHAALRQTGYRFYRRCHHAPPYTRKDPLFYGNPYDNLHCAWNLNVEEPGFRSSGCLVVSGWPHCPRLLESKPNQGGWKMFHDYLYQSPQTNFSLLLLPALEIGVSLSRKKSPTRFCFGSQGPKVEELQRQLIRGGKLLSKPNGILGPSTYRAWNLSLQHDHPHPT